MKKLLGFLILACLMSTGCSTLPSPQEMKAEIVNFTLPQLPKEGEAMVYVVRPSVLGTLIRFNVFLDNEEAEAEMGYTRGSQYIYFPVEPGVHTIYSEAENTAEISITAKAGDIYFIQQEPQMGFIMARNNIFQIPDYQGKYQVKNLSMGTLVHAFKE